MYSFSNAGRNLQFKFRIGVLSPLPSMVLKSVHYLISNALVLRPTNCTVVIEKLI